MLCVDGIWIHCKFVRCRRENEYILLLKEWNCSVWYDVGTDWLYGVVNDSFPLLSAVHQVSYSDAIHYLVDCGV